MNAYGNTKKAELAVVEEFVVSPLPEREGRYQVFSKKSDKVYTVDATNGACTCPDWGVAGTCRHVAVAREVLGLGGNKGSGMAIAEASTQAAKAELASDSAVARINVPAMLKELEAELGDDLVKSYVYRFIDRRGREVKEISYEGARDIARMIASRYGPLELGDLALTDTGDRLAAKVKLKLGNFETYGYADEAKDAEYAYSHVCSQALAKAYRNIVPAPIRRYLLERFTALHVDRPWER